MQSDKLSIKHDIYTLSNPYQSLLVSYSSKYITKTFEILVFLRSVLHFLKTTVKGYSNYYGTIQIVELSWNYPELSP